MRASQRTPGGTWPCFTSSWPRPIGRWGELATAWSAHIDDAFCSFNDLHAMLAFVGARDWANAQRLERALTASRSLPTRHARTTRQLGLSACRALIAFGRGRYIRAIGLLAGLAAFAHRLGGSHAQRDVLHLTLMQAIERLRRPARRLLGAGLPVAHDLSHPGVNSNGVQPFGAAASLCLATNLPRA